MWNMATLLQMNLWLETLEWNIFGFEAGFVLGMGCVDVLELQEEL